MGSFEFFTRAMRSSIQTQRNHVRGRLFLFSSKLLMPGSEFFHDALSHPWTEQEPVRNETVWYDYNFFHQQMGKVDLGIPRTV
jgi:hypothetical protein